MRVHPRAVASPTRRPSAALVAMIPIAALVYSLPLVLGIARSAHVANVTSFAETIYLARIADAYRGNALGNAYLAEHETATQYMPVLGERLLGGIARYGRLDPLTVAAGSRILLPVVLLLLVWTLARRLQLSPAAASLAAVLPLCAPSASGWSTGSPLFLRYFSAISPVLYVVLLMGTLLLVHRCWQKVSTASSLVAGVAVGLLFYAPVYYWSFVLCGTLVLGVTATQEARRRLLASLLLGVLIGSPNLLHMYRAVQETSVQETLRRVEVFTTGRIPGAASYSYHPPPEFPRVPNLAPDINSLPRFAVGVAVCLLVWRNRKKLPHDAAYFLLPFLVTGTLLLVQNVVTGRHLSSFHWIECLIPLWGVVCAGFLERWFPRFILVAITLISVVGAGVQVLGYFQLETVQRNQPGWWTLETRMPETLAWLNQNTPRDSVILSQQDVMDSLVLFTHNRPYWAHFAAQHVMSDSEIDMRLKNIEEWDPRRPGPLPFRADFYLGSGKGCEETALGRPLYWNPKENTCLFALPRSSPG